MSNYNKKVYDLQVLRTMYDNHINKEKVKIFAQKHKQIMDGKNEVLWIIELFSHIIPFICLLNIDLKIKSFLEMYLRVKSDGHLHRILITQIQKWWGETFKEKQLFSICHLYHKCIGHKFYDINYITNYLNENHNNLDNFIRINSIDADVYLMIKKVEIEMQSHFQFYIKSIREAENEIKTVSKTGKALKDIIGTAWENHRKRIWEHFGFTVSKDNYGAMFKVDWSILYKGKLVAFEEDKGHYLDYTFLVRALSGFCQTINKYKKQNQTVPAFIIHSFTQFNSYNEKLENDLDTRKVCIKNVMKKKLHYTFLVNRDRLKPWFTKDCDTYDYYSINVSHKLIKKDIEFIQSFIPVSE